MTRRGLCTWLAAVALWPLGLLAAEAPRPTGTIAEGTEWATAYLVQEGKRPGPTVLVVGGMHGDEVAGVKAADQITQWPIVRGKLVVIPRANEAALKKHSRLLPTDEDRNLNRDFPQSADDQPKGELARAIWEFVRQARPDWLLDLHEAIGVRQQLKTSTGSTIIHDFKRDTRAQAEHMLEAINATIEDPTRKFVLLRGPIKGGIARSAADLLGVHAMILEVTSTAQLLSLRSRQHQILVHRLLSDLEMLPPDFDPFAPGK